MYKTCQVRTIFWSCDVEKLHAAVARSTFQSQNAKKLTGSDHFLKLRCRKIARRCGEKHISKSKCQKTEGYGPLFEVAMSKNCTPLWREAHFKVKMSKNWGVRTTFGRSEVQKWWKNGTPLWRHRRKFRSLTSDNMDSWKSSAARKKINRCGKKEDQQARNVSEMLGKSRNAVFFNVLCVGWVEK